MTRRQSSPRRPDELDELKRRVNITEYAATYGYRLDRPSSSRNSATMVHPAGDKIIVAKGEDGHWVYFSVRDDADNGSIIDFIQRRENVTLGEVRKMLRNWSGGSAPPERGRLQSSFFVPDLDHIRKDLVMVRVRYEAMRPIDGQHKYLEEVRNIPPHILTDPLFADRIRVDDHGNAVFPHYNRDGLCGYELKNDGFTRFASGSIKGLWFSSRTGEADRRLVIAETGIDAISHAALHRYEPGTRYLSTGGELNPDQPLLLESAMKKLPDGGQVILAVDNDAGGDKIGAKIHAVFEMVNRPALSIDYDRPAGRVKDWNDSLRASKTLGEAVYLKPPKPWR